MNDTEFEESLRKTLQPIAPSAELHRRIRLELSEPRGVPASGVLRRPAAPGVFLRFLRDFGWACAGAAAALAIFAYLPMRHTAQTPVATSTQPVAPVAQPATAQVDSFEHEETTYELLATEDSDEFVQTDDGPAHEIRYTYRERHEWTNSHTGAHVVLEVPREDVYLYPVALQ